MHPHWPLTPGSWIKYAVFDIEGDFDPDSGYFGITKQSPHANSPQQCTVVQRGALRGRCFHQPGQPAIITPGNTIYQALWDGCVTEAAGTRCTQSGGIPLLPEKPVLGPSEGCLAVCHFDTDGEPVEFGEYRYKRWVHHIGQPWATWPDTIRTSLIENVPANVVIAYVFARGVGPVDYWRGELQPDGKTVLNGTRFYCIGNG
jgi:hypothetical protein